MRRATVVGNAIFDNSLNSNFASVTISNGASAVDNLVYGNGNGVELDDRTTFSGNRIFGNTGFGLQIGIDNAVVTQNVFYSNGVSVQNIGLPGLNFTNNIVYADTIAGLRLRNATNASIANNTFYEPTAGTISDPIPSNGSGAIVLDGTSTGASIIDNIIVALTGVGIRVADLSQLGFVSDYNLFQTGSGGRVGNWQGIDRTSFAQWRSATARDGKSRFADPLFVSPTGADGKLGYSSILNNGSDDDFHVQSLHGSFHGGSLAVVVNPATGLPVFPGAVLTTDAVSSPAIDGGNPSVPVGAEPSPNGGIVEIGAYGGTAQASLSPATFLTVTRPMAARC